MNDVAAEKPVSTNTAKIIYILYLVGLANGVTLIVGLFIAHLKKNEAPDWLKTHYQFQIRTFWLGLLYCLIGGVLSLVYIGILVLIFAAIWLIIRVMKGFNFLEQRQPVANYETWLF